MFWGIDLYQKMFLWKMFCRFFFVKRIQIYDMFFIIHFCCRCWYLVSCMHFASPCFGNGLWVHGGVSDLRSLIGQDNHDASALFIAADLWTEQLHGKRPLLQIDVTIDQGGGRKRLPKFKFSAKFPIGLHVILQIQIKKFENDCYIMWKIILTENPSRFNVEPLLK